MIKVALEESKIKTTTCLSFAYVHEHLITIPSTFSFNWERKTKQKVGIQKKAPQEIPSKTRTEKEREKPIVQQ